MDYNRHLKNISRNLENLVRQMKDIEKRLGQCSEYEEDTSSPVAFGSKETYEKVITDWQRKYGDIEGIPTLLQDDKRRTVISFTNDPLYLNRRISDSDILNHGLYSFPLDFEQPGHSNVEDIFKRAQVSPRQVRAIRQWLKKEVEAARRSTEMCEALKDKLKQLLIEKKGLKSENERLRLKVNSLEAELRQYPTEEEEMETAKEIEYLKETIDEISNDHHKTIKTKQQLLKVLREETMRGASSDRKLTQQIKELNEDSIYLKQLKENISQQAASLFNQLYALSECFKRMSKLMELLDKARQVLEEESNRICKLSQGLSSECGLLEQLKEHSFTIQSIIGMLQTKVEEFSTVTMQLQNDIEWMQNEVVKVSNTFNSASEHIDKNVKLLGEKEEREGKMKETAGTLANQKKEIQELKKSIVQLTREVDKMNVPLVKCLKRINLEDEDADEKKELLLWNDKVMSILSIAEELDDIVEQTKVQGIKEKSERLKEKKNDVTKDRYETGSLEARYTLSSAFTSTNVSKGHQYTITGKDSILKDFHKNNK